MTLTILNDCHIGVLRSGGTTPETAWELRQFVLRSFADLVEDTPGDLLILGDLFDTGNVPMMDLLTTWGILRQFVGTRRKLYLVKGNHDAVKNKTLLSSFQFLCRLLKEDSDNVVEIDGSYYLKSQDFYVISHVDNQDLFNLELSKVPACRALLLHCNYDNHFAVESDHSLNLSPEQAIKLPVREIIIAHEHQARLCLSGKVVLPGNQIPSSVSDCLGNDFKGYLVWNEDRFEQYNCWKAEGSYSEQDWRDLKDTGQFIRVVGEAAAAEAADVVSAISKFRNKSKAFVITNAVKIQGADDGQQIEVSLEKVKAFNVLDCLLDGLDDREKGVVRELLKGRENV